MVKVKKQFRQATCELTMLESHETPPCHLILRAVKNSRAFAGVEVFVLEPGSKMVLVSQK